MDLRALIAPVVDFALPPRCPGCGTIVGGDGRFCSDCWQALTFLTADGCALCNTPLPGPAGTICGNCLAQPPRHDGVRAAVAYGDIARALALRLKYGRKTGLARPMGTAIARHVDGDGLLVPVPLHRWRLWSRGFNQAAAIARVIAQDRVLTVDTALLVRIRATPPLRGLSRKARADAVRGVFRTTRKLAGETIWLVDDVYTSGATAEACAGVLKRAGAGRVVVLAWARVLRDVDGY